MKILKVLYPLLILLPLYLPLTAFADHLLEGYTMVHGKGYGFELKAPKGWVLDRDAGRSSGLAVVFYPQEAAWESSPAVCYAQVKTIDASVQTIDDQIRNTVQRWKEQGVTNARAQLSDTWTTVDASQAKVYLFPADQFGNRQATAYLRGRNSINFISFSARDEKNFHFYYPAFRSLVTSYEDLLNQATKSAAQ